MKIPAAARVPLLAVALLILAACGSKQATGTGQPHSGGELRIIDYQAWTCLAPQSTGYNDTVITNQLYDRLTFQDPETGEIKPWLAESWTVNADATEYTFTLRDGATFSDGTPLDAEAVKENYDEFGKGNLDLGVTPWGYLTGYDRAEVVSPNQVAIHFSAPNVAFLQATSFFAAGILSPASLKLSYQDRCQGKNAVGSGPFVYDSERDGKEISLKRRAGYSWGPPSLNHQGAAYLDKLVYTIVPEGSVRVGSLLAGQADTVRGVLPNDEHLVTAAKGYHLDVLKAGVANQLTVNPDTPNLEDVRVRQALNYGIDRNEFKSTILSDSYDLATSTLGRRNPGWVDESAKFAYDPDKAKALLDDAGWKPGADGIREKDGKKLVVPAYVSPFHITADPGFALLQEQWKRIGVDLQIQKADLSVFSKVVREPAVNAFKQGSPTRLDPDILRTEWDSQLGNVVNHTFPQLDQLVTAQNAETDPAKRQQLVTQAQDFIIDNGLSFPLYEDVLVYGSADYVKDVRQEAQGRPIYLTTWLDK